ncbi:hypothetical protein V6N12_006143 [Hibiscus sabdariffa]|uniref:Uncharacterized protein n=1 Tax=Hibiscus sabdariffa TaxID=183260 RepID=A0ABR2EX57_9ROSI
MIWVPKRNVVGEVDKGNQVVPTDPGLIASSFSEPKILFDVEPFAERLSTSSRPCNVIHSPQFDGVGTSREVNGCVVVAGANVQEPESVAQPSVPMVQGLESVTLASEPVVQSPVPMVQSPESAVRPDSPIAIREPRKAAKGVKELVQEIKAAKRKNKKNKKKGDGGGKAGYPSP